MSSTDKAEDLLAMKRTIEQAQFSVTELTGRLHQIQKSIEAAGFTMEDAPSQVEKMEDEIRTTEIRLEKRLKSLREELQRFENTRSA